MRLQVDGDWADSKPSATRAVLGKEGRGAEPTVIGTEIRILANGRCAAMRGPSLGFTSARVCRGRVDGWLSGSDRTPERNQLARDGSLVTEQQRLTTRAAQQRWSRGRSP